LDWEIGGNRKELLQFVARMIALRREHPVFRRRAFFRGEHASGGKDIVWLRPDGAEMTSAEWQKDFARCLGMYLSGDALPETDLRGQPIRDDNFLLLFNAHHDQIPFRMPSIGRETAWFAMIDTAVPDGTPKQAALKSGSDYPLQGRSLALLRQIDLEL
jgi:glycogen operon protein